VCRSTASAVIFHPCFDEADLFAVALIAITLRRRSIPSRSE
jgi:hypothetical protein